MLKTVLALFAALTTAFILAQACGSDKETEDTSTQTKYDFTKDINPIIVASCSGSTCHGKTGAGSTVYEEQEKAFLNSETETKRRMALAATDAAFMPRTPKTISAADKEKLIKFLDQ